MKIANFLGDMNYAKISTKQIKEIVYMITVEKNTDVLNFILETILDKFSSDYYIKYLSKENKKIAISSNKNLKKIINYNSIIVDIFKKFSETENIGIHIMEDENMIKITNQRIRIIKLHKIFGEDISNF